MRKIAPQVFFKIFLDDELIFTSRVFAKSANPMLDLQVEISSHLRFASRLISIEVHDANDSNLSMMNDSVDPHRYIGTANILIDDVLNSKLLGSRYKMTKNIRPDPTQYTSPSKLSSHTYASNRTGLTQQTQQDSHPKLNLEVEVVSLSEQFEKRVR